MSPELHALMTQRFRDIAMRNAAITQQIDEQLRAEDLPFRWIHAEDESLFGGATYDVKHRLAGYELDFDGTASDISVTLEYDSSTGRVSGAVYATASGGIREDITYDVDGLPVKAFSTV